MTTLVLVETDAAGLVEVSAEALTFAREQVVVDGAPEAVHVGVVDDSLRARLAALGVARVHEVSGAAYSSYAAAAWAAAVEQVADSIGAGVVLAGGTPRGTEVAAHVAARRGVAMAANAVAVLGGDPLRVQRQVVGALALEEVLLTDPLAVLTMAGHAVEPKDAPVPETTVVGVQVDVDERDLRARVVRVEERERADTGALTGARVVVGAGRGAGGADGFDDLLELTELLGGALGVSRVVTSLGWRPHHEQVGQTGSRITPDLYVACGISGAIQHWAGCSGARTILAINTDAEAPMMTKAHYAVVGDLHEVVPAINAELRSRLGR